MLYRERSPEAPWVSEGLSARDWRARKFRRRQEHEHAPETDAPHYVPPSDWLDERERGEQR